MHYRTESRGQEIRRGFHIARRNAQPARVTVVRSHCCQRPRQALAMPGSGSGTSTPLPRRGQRFACVTLRASPPDLPASFLEKRLVEPQLRRSLGRAALVRAAFGVHDSALEGVGGRLAGQFAGSALPVTPPPYSQGSPIWE